MKRIKLALLGAAALVPAASVLFASAATTVTNGDFSNGVAGWTNFGGNPQPFFGGMMLTNDYAGTGNSYYSAYQCITGITPGYKYTLSGEAVVAKGAPEFGSASLTLHFFDTPDCSGPVTGGSSARDGLNPARHGEILKLTTSAVAEDTVKSAWVRPTAMKEPKAPADSAPGDLYVAFDNITLTKALVVQLVPLDPKIEPEDPQPEPEDPQPEPLDEPEQPGDDPPQPADVPQEQPGNEPAPPLDGAQQPADEPQGQGADTHAAPDEDPETPGSGNANTNSDAKPASGSTAPQPIETAPLPPSTGQGEEVQNIGWMVIAGCLAAIAAGGMMVLFAVRNRSGERAA